MVFWDGMDKNNVKYEYIAKNGLKIPQDEFLWSFSQTSSVIHQKWCLSSIFFILVLNATWKKDESVIYH